jgi:hypothetical protein
MFDRLRSLFGRAPALPRRVQVGETEVAVTEADGTVAALRWDELAAVVIETNDSGPWGDDVVFHLFAADGTRRLRVPQSVDGQRELLQSLQRLPDFDNAAVLAAMGSTALEAFLCWEAPGWSGGDHQPLIAFARTWRARHPADR